jgi:sulfite exporter TauE/SafE
MEEWITEIVLFVGAMILIMGLTIAYKNSIIREQAAKIQKLETTLKEMIEIGKSAL